MRAKKGLFRANSEQNLIIRFDGYLELIAFAKIFGWQTGRTPKWGEKGSFSHNHAEFG
jgi:hypothetical protein